MKQASYLRAQLEVFLDLLSLNMQKLVELIEMIIIKYVLCPTS